MGVKFSVAGQGSREASLWTYSQLGIYGPREPFIAVLTFPASNKESEISGFPPPWPPSHPSLNMLEAFGWSWDTSHL